MIAYAGQRLGWAIVLLWFITMFTFVLLHLIPGNPALVLAGMGAKKSQVQAMYVQLGLNKPLPVQYFKYLDGLVHLNLGRSAVTNDAVTTDLARYLPATIELVVISFTIYVLLAIPLGAWTARHQGRVAEALVRVTAIIGSGMPVFWLGALFQGLFFAKLHWLPEGGELAITASAPPDRTGLFVIDSAAGGTVGNVLADDPPLDPAGRDHRARDARGRVAVNPCERLARAGPALCPHCGVEGRLGGPADDRARDEERTEPGGQSSRVAVRLHARLDRARRDGVQLARYRAVPRTTRSSRSTMRRSWPSPC